MGSNPTATATISANAERLPRESSAFGFWTEITVRPWEPYGDIKDPARRRCRGSGRHRPSRGGRSAAKGSRGERRGPPPRQVRGPRCDARTADGSGAAAADRAGGRARRGDAHDSDHAEEHRGDRLRGVQTAVERVVLGSCRRDRRCDAMRCCGAARVIAITSSGVRADDHELAAWYRLLVRPLLRDVYEDMARMEQIFTNAELEWCFVRPVFLTDREGEDPPRIEDAQTPAGGRTVSRGAVARFIVGEIESRRWTRKAPTLAV